MLPRYTSNPYAPGSPDLRDNSMADEWGDPSVDTSPVRLAQDGLLGQGGSRAFRMPLPQWQPGEFEEWKQAKMSGGSTEYGRAAQMRYKSRNIPGMASLMQEGWDNANYPGVSALMALGRGRGRR